MAGVLACKTVPPASQESPGEKAEAPSPQEVSVSAEAKAPGPESALETQKTAGPDLSEAPLFLGETPILVGEVPSPPAFPEPSAPLKIPAESQTAVVTDKTASSLTGEEQTGKSLSQDSSGTSPRQERPTEPKPSASSTSSTEQKKTTTPPVLKPTEPIVAEQKTESPASTLQNLPEPAVRGEKGLPEALSYSRSVRALVGQLVEVPFQGGGWIYLGEVAGRRGLVYDSRRTDPEGQTFIFRAEDTGLYSLKFFRQDFLQDYVINDYVRVEVVQNPEITETGGFRLAPDRGRVVAEPRWPPRSAGAAVAANPESSKGSGNQSGGDIASSSTRGEQGNNTSVSSSVPPANAGTPAPVSSGTAGGSANVPSGAAPGTASSSAGGPAMVSGGSVDSPAVTPSSGTGTTAGGTQTLSVAGASAGSTVSSLSAVPGSAGTPSGLSPLSGVPLASSALPENTSLDALLRQAREAYEKKQYAVALELLNQMNTLYPAGTDEALWLMGQIFETQGPHRDIKKAYDTYKRLLEEFPTSSRYDEAQRRMRYIERFYFNIR